MAELTASMSKECSRWPVNGLLQQLLLRSLPLTVRAELCNTERTEEGVITSLAWRGWPLADRHLSLHHDGLSCRVVVTNHPMQECDTTAADHADLRKSRAGLGGASRILPFAYGPTDALPHFTRRQENHNEKDGEHMLRRQERKEQEWERQGARMHLLLKRNTLVSR